MKPGRKRGWASFEPFSDLTFNILHRALGLLTRL